MGDFIILLSLAGSWLTNAPDEYEELQEEQKH